MLCIALATISCEPSSFVMNNDILDETAIILPQKPNSINLFSADELNHHLKLIYGKELPILYKKDETKYKQHIILGTQPKGYEKKLSSEEGVYLIKDTDLYVFGYDKINSTYSTSNPGDYNNIILSEVLDMRYNQTGSLFALYNFIEKELDVTWLKSGENGIFYTKKISKSLKNKEVSWLPSFIQRNIRTGDYKTKTGKKFAPNEFALTEEERIQSNIDHYVWLRRMKFGYSNYYQFQHAFNTYWDDFKDTKPDIFALNGNGERKPYNRKDRKGRTERIKMCPSNEDLPGIMVEKWLEAKKNNPLQHSGSISVCENDSDGFGDPEWCHCQECLALDTRKEGEALSKSLSDRYIHLWNKVVIEAQKYQKDILVSGYAYEQMLLPPKRERLHPSTLVEFVPELLADFDKTQKLYDDWRAVGMTKMYFRPNDLHWQFGMSLGLEKRVFEHFQLAVKNGAEGTDYDSLIIFGEGVSDMVNFILAKAHQNPNESFENLENEFLHVFGDAKVEIKEFYRYWREIYTNELVPEDLALSDGRRPAFFKFGKMGGLTRRIDEFYEISDFDKTDTLLNNALKKDISDQAKDYIKRMKISNQHSRMTFIALMAGINGHSEELMKKTKELIAFRIENKNNIDVDWEELFNVQYRQLKDQLGTKKL